MPTNPGLVRRLRAEGLKCHHSRPGSFSVTESHSLVLLNRARNTGSGEKG